MSRRSIVEYFAAHEGYSCGYCKSPNTCYSHGLWGHVLTPIDYQNLIDRGWRRSGKYCYKPTMTKICCPQYTIRCEAAKFSLSKSQKKVLKKVNKFLTHGRNEESSPTPSNKDQEMDISDTSHVADVQHLKNISNITDIVHAEVNTVAASFDNENSKALNYEDVVDSAPSSFRSDDVVRRVSSHSNSNTTAPDSTSNKNTLDQTRPPCRKAKDIRRERRLQKMLAAGKTQEEINAVVVKNTSQQKELEDFILQYSPEHLHKLELRWVPSDVENPLFLRTFDESHNLYQKYQTIIHKDTPEKCSKKQFTRFLVNTPFQLRLVPADLDSQDFMRSFDESYALYKRYQMAIHHDAEEECNVESFHDFLVVSPIQDFAGDTYGSFHQQYWLDDKLIAVGVLDVLPFCVSSVYFYYDPEYNYLSLGTYAALRELAFVRELTTRFPALQYYYMGFYIHSCIKMRYKGQYYPSYLLCPETYLFQPIEKCKPKLDVSKYSRFEEDQDKVDTDGIVHLKEVLILYDRSPMTYPMYQLVNKDASDEDVVRQYAGFVGKKCYRKILLYRS